MAKSIRKPKRESVRVKERRRSFQKPSRTATRKPREPLRNVDGILVAKERVRPSYLPVLRAFIECVDEGKAPTYVNLARKLARSRQAVQQLVGRHPDLLPWINRQISSLNASYTAAVVRRAAMLAIQGSKEHMDVFLRYAAGAYGQSDGAGGDGATPGAHTVQVNLLVPRPEYPQGAMVQAPVKRLPPPDLPPSVVASQQ